METETSGRDPWDGILEWSLLDAGQEPLASVLVVDDSETVARKLEWELCMSGYQFELASEGKTAIKASLGRYVQASGGANNATIGALPRASAS